MTLMEAAADRNVKHMKNMVEGLVQESMKGDGVVQLEDDINQALTIIKGTLIDGIRNTLLAEHKTDQEEIMASLACFDGCRGTRHGDEDKCDEQTSVINKLRTDHVSCRSSVKAKYVTKILDCNKLDDWVKAFKLTRKVKESCVYDEQWKCYTENDTPATPDIDQKFGHWLKDIIEQAKEGFKSWTKLHNQCAASYHAYINADSSCDQTQKEFENTVFEKAQCQYTACQVEFTRCRKSCMDSYYATVKRVECAEKDRKIDWSATEKMECYIAILLASPTDERLQEVCKDDMTNCISKWRTVEYNKCETVCKEVDFETGSYSQHVRRHAVAGEVLDHNKEFDSSTQAHRQHADNIVQYDRTHGVNTTHRGEGEDRCTSHLDIDFQPIPCALPCPDPELPCTDEWVKREYLQFDSQNEVSGQLTNARHCHAGEHSEWYAYNRCECKDRGQLVGTPGLVDDIYCESSKITPLYYVNHRTFHLMDFEHESLLWNDRTYTLSCTTEMLGARYWLQPHKAMDYGEVRMSKVPLGARVYVAVEDTIQHWRTCNTRPCQRDGNIVFDETWKELGKECHWQGFRNTDWEMVVWSKIVTSEEDITFWLSENWVGFAAYKEDGH